MKSSFPASTEREPTSPACASGSFPLFAALILAVSGLAGSLFLSLGMQLKACPLCFYQRTFMMSLVALLGMGLLAGTARTGRLSLLSLPLAIAGLGIAGFHTWLEVGGRLECPQGVFGFGTAPQQSLAVFAILSGLLLFDVLRQGAVVRVLAFAAFLLGAALAVASCTSNPPMPEPPTKPYPGPPEICRPPFTAR